MKHKKKNAKTAALRLINDIALVDITLASKLQPSIMRFAESVEYDAPQTLDKTEVLNKLSEFFTISDKQAKKDWLSKNKEVSEYIQNIMDKTDDLIGEDTDEQVTVEPDETSQIEQEFNVVDDDTEELIGELDKAKASLANPESQRGILDKVQISTKVRSYIETCLAELINTKLHASIVEQAVEGYKADYAGNGFDNRLDTAFSRLLDVLVETLLGNYK